MNKYYVFIFTLKHQDKNKFAKQLLKTCLQKLFTVEQKVKQVC